MNLIWSSWGTFFAMKNLLNTFSSIKSVCGDSSLPVGIGQCLVIGCLTVAGVQDIFWWLYAGWGWMYAGFRWMYAVESDSESERMFWGVGVRGGSEVSSSTVWVVARASTVGFWVAWFSERATCEHVVGATVGTVTVDSYGNGNGWQLWQLKLKKDTVDS